MIYCERSTWQPFSSISRIRTSWQLCSSVPTGEEGEGSNGGGSGPDNGLACTISFWWNSGMRSRPSSSISIGCSNICSKELEARVGPMITKQNTCYRQPIGMKLAPTLRHLASGNKYVPMKFALRVPHNTQSLMTWEVCQAIVDEYLDEVMPCPNTPQEWQAISDQFMAKWNFLHILGAPDGKHVACKCPPIKWLYVLQLQVVLLYIVVLLVLRRLQVYLVR